MAEFKLGRIRFIWKGSWVTAKEYFKDDVVRYGGRTYIVNIGHISSNFDSQIANFDKMADGNEWKGNWALSTVYKPNDIVKYGGYLYIANTGHTSASTTSDGLELDQSKWDLFCEGFDWLGDWGITTRYKVNDIVRYGGVMYLCTEAHTSGATVGDGLELDDTKWDLFANGLTWLNAWIATTRYKKGDVVRYGGQVYVCNTGHTAGADNTAGLEEDQAKWDYLHKGIEYLGDWVTGTRYKNNDVVKYGSDLWICGTFHTAGATLAADEAKWSIFIPGLEFEDSWQNNENFQPGDVVTYGGYTYVSKTNNFNIIPYNNASDWDLFTTGFSFKGDYNNATAYKIGDVVRLGGWTFIALADGTGNRPPDAVYWDKLNEGLYWKNAWTNATYYDKGDVVRGINDVNSYVCIAPHTSEQVGAGQNRPDQDTAGNFWNLLNGGAEAGNLTTRGDLVYYGGSGPTRLPVGQPGQVLKVNETGTDPVWSFFGQLDAVYYTALDGVDADVPAAGVTLDKPFRTVQFGLQQIEKGARKPNATKLLKRNKAFIQDEVISWVDTQIVGSISPFTGSFTYTAADWRRDIGTFIDALVWDLSHGGNKRTRLETLAYFDSAADQYYVSNDGITAEFGAALTFITTLIDDVITQDAPATDYQAARSVATPTLRITDSTLTEEPEAQGVLNALRAVATAALTAGNTTGVPAQLVANDTLFVKTGQFNEVLPMVVPQGCAVVGDELRSTKISPAGQLTNSGDSVYSIAGLEHLATIIDDVVTNSAVTSTQNSFVVLASNASATTLDIMTGANSYAHTYTSGGTVTFSGTTVNVTAAAYDNVTGIVSITTDAAHGAVATNVVEVASITWTCSLGTKVYPAVKAQDVAAPAGSSAAGTAAAGVATAIKNKIDFVLNANGSDVAFAGVNDPVKTAGYTDAVLRLEANKEFLVEEVVSKISIVYPAYSFTTALKNSCKRDVRRYIEAIQHDIIYTGNYKGLRAAELYINSANGSTLNDMFYVRNGTGIRNMTLIGLSGTLGSVNTYGTQRPTAGSYVSLDPGWGTAHKDVWIINKSCYVQNVTNFGTGCVGLKIDGDLHAGGNDSIVANDFTQVLSDGIGVWCTNLGRTELVSVFSYYGHIGYLAENGGKIRATNGNSSYGTFGAVAEGVDSTEVPILAYTDNKDKQAQIGQVMTDAARVIAVEYLNAGRDYDTNGGNANITITGDGFGLGTVTPTYRTGGVMEVRLLNTSDNFGGKDYNTAGNAAQIGNATQITISNTDTNTSGELAGMAIWIVSGLGTGQYAYIDSYNAGTKVATVKKYSDNSAGWDNIIGEAIVPLLDSTTTYEIEPRLTFSTPTGDGSSTSVQAIGRCRVQDQKINQIRIIEPGQGYDSSVTMTITDPNNTIEAPFEIRVGDGVLGQPTFAGATNAGRGDGFDTATALVTATTIEKNITGVSKANPCRVTATAHGITLDGTKVNIKEVLGMIRLFDPTTFYVRVIDADNFDLYKNPTLTETLDTTSQGTYTTGGKVTYGGGFMDNLQSGKFVQVSGLNTVPRAGSNVVFANQPTVFYKLVAITNLLGGSEGPFTAQLQVSPNIPVDNAPVHTESSEIRLRYSQVRLTGHDFLDIGTGNFTNTNYPNLPLQDPVPASEAVEGGGGRVFFTSTDQDGNFRVGGLFNVEQSTGVATLNADAFNISGLQELSLGNIALGNTGATVNEFSTDGTFAANSDSIVPTQRAIRTYITSQIGGGASTLNVNQIIAGLVQISGQEITTTTVVPINVKAQFNFQGGVDGAPVALNMFLMG